jgi:hypothetical protein
MIPMRTRRRAALLLALLVLGGALAPVHAQEAILTPPKFDQRLVELTPERIVGVIRASLAAQRFNEGPDGPPHFVPQREEIALKISYHSEKFGTQIGEYNDRVNEYENCRGSAIEEIRKANKDALMSKRPPDMATIMLMTDFARAQAEAQQRGDTAALAKLVKAFDARFNPTPAQIAELEKNCGGVPAQPAYAIEAKALEAQQAKVDEAMNTALQQLYRIQETESGLARGPYVTALERLCAYVARAERKAAQQGFSSLELQALQRGHPDAVKACSKGWN